MTNFISPWHFHYVQVAGRQTLHIIQLACSSCLTSMQNFLCFSPFISKVPSLTAFKTDRNKELLCKFRRKISAQQQVIQMPIRGLTHPKQTVSSTECIRKSVHFCDNWRQRKNAVFNDTVHMYDYTRSLAEGCT